MIGILPFVPTKSERTSTNGGTSSFSIYLSRCRLLVLRSLETKMLKSKPLSNCAQFNQVANLYFLTMVILQCVPAISITNGTFVAVNASFVCQVEL